MADPVLEALIERAKGMYEDYAATVPTENPAPPWEELPEWLQEDWIQAAEEL
jgi:hypothetical protein